jgi:hypothetical protein
MKNHYIQKNAVTAFVCLGLAMLCCAATSQAASKKSDAPAQNAGDSAQLVVVRTPSVGSGIAASISVDGKELANLTQGKSFRGPLTPGKHVISVSAHPNLTGKQSNKTEFTAEKGQTYSFSVSSKSGEVVLVKKP